MTGRPVRLQLSRAKGFNLQRLSLATNGLPALNVARPTRDGNPFRIGENGLKYPDEVVAAHRAEIEVQCAGDPQAADLMWKRLRGNNLARWCKLGDPCHADTLLELANR